jgi:glycosyltransferase involved in cell wall biosynthesis
LHDVVKGTHWTEKLAAACPPDLLLSNSHFTAEARGIFTRQPAKVLYHPVKAPHIVKTRSEVRSHLSTSDKAVVITQVSRMAPWKGHRMLFRALGLLKDVPDWVCWVTGGVQREEEEEYWRELQHLARETGIESRVRFLGHRVDVPDILGASDIFCQPNEAPEPFGIVFIEALYAGLPVVSVKSGGAEELLSEGGGFLSPVGDCAALAGNLHKLVSEKETRIKSVSLGPSYAARLCDPSQQLRAMWKCMINAGPRPERLALSF